MTPTRRTVPTALSLGLLMAWAGCKPAETPEAPVHPEVRIAQRCAELGDPPSKIDTGKSRVFVELSHVVSSPLPSPLGNWLDDHPVSVRSVSNFLVTPTRPTSMPWGDCLDEGCNTRAQNVTLGVELPENGASPLRLSMRLADGDGAPGGNGGAGAARPLLETTLELFSQVPVVVPGARAAVGDDQLVAAAYLLVQPRDFFKLMGCKANQVGADEIRPLQRATASAP